MTDPIWRDVPGWEGIMQASNCGGLRNITNPDKPREIQPYTDQWGKRFELWHKGRRQSIRKGALLSLTFPDLPKPKRSRKPGASAKPQGLLNAGPRLVWSHQIQRSLA